MLAKVELPSLELADVLSVPVGAVLRIEEKDHVLVRNDAGAIELRAVVLGRSNDRAVEVRQGLRAGDRVSTHPPAAGPPAPWTQRADPK